MSGFFCALAFFFGFQLEGTLLLLLLIPIAFAIFLLGAALIATDQGLEKMMTFLMAFS